MGKQVYLTDSQVELTVHALQTQKLIEFDRENQEKANRCEEIQDKILKK